MDLPLLNREQQNEARKVVQEWLEKDVLMWHQRYGVMWFTKWEEKSRYFHQKASSRRCKNIINKLQADIGEWKEGNQLDYLIVDYFQSKFSTTGIKGTKEFLEPLEVR